MAIAIEKSFTVEAPMDAVWVFLTDPYSVARCLPGASITEQIDDKTYAGKITIKVGPVSSSYKGKIVFERLDLETRTAEISGRGQDVRGRGGADMKMMSRLTETDGGTAVNVVSEVNVTGILAQFGQGMIQSVSDQLFQTFTERMKAELTAADRPVTPGGDDDAVDVVSLGAEVGRRALGRTLRRPRFWLGVAVGLVLYFLIF